MSCSESGRGLHKPTLKPSFTNGDSPPKKDYPRTPFNRKSQTRRSLSASATRICSRTSAASSQGRPSAKNVILSKLQKDAISPSSPSLSSSSGDYLKALFGSEANKESKSNNDKVQKAESSTTKPEQEFHYDDSESEDSSSFDEDSSSDFTSSSCCSLFDSDSEESNPDDFEDVSDDQQSFSLDSSLHSRKKQKSNNGVIMNKALNDDGGSAGTSTVVNGDGLSQQSASMLQDDQHCIKVQALKDEAMQQPSNSKSSLDTNPIALPTTQIHTKQITSADYVSLASHSRYAISQTDLVWVLKQLESLQKAKPQNLPNSGKRTSPKRLARCFGSMLHGPSHSRMFYHLNALPPCLIYVSLDKLVYHPLYLKHLKVDELKGKLLSIISERQTASKPDRIDNLFFVGPRGIRVKATNELVQFDVHDGDTFSCTALEHSKDSSKLINVLLKRKRD